MFSDFKKRFEENKKNRNLSLAYLLASIISVPFLLILGVTLNLSTFLDQKSKLFNIITIPLAVLPVTILNFIIRGLLIVYMLIPALVLNWSIAFIQALRHKKTPLGEEYRTIAGSLMEDMFDQNEKKWKSLVFICLNPVQCWKAKTATGNSHLNTPIPQELGSPGRQEDPLEQIKTKLEQMQIKAKQEDPLEQIKTKLEQMQIKAKQERMQINQELEQQIKHDDQEQIKLEQITQELEQITQELEQIKTRLEQGDEQERDKTALEQIKTRLEQIKHDEQERDKTALEQIKTRLEQDDEQEDEQEDMSRSVTRRRWSRSRLG